MPRHNTFVPSHGKKTHFLKVADTAIRKARIARHNGCFEEEYIMRCRAICARGFAGLRIDYGDIMSRNIAKYRMQGLDPAHAQERAGRDVRLIRIRDEATKHAHKAANHGNYKEERIKRLRAIAANSLAGNHVDRGHHKAVLVAMHMSNGHGLSAAKLMASDSLEK